MLLLRGREGLNVFMTHPYLGLDLSEPGNVKFKGALGYNNDPTRGFRELPPFHSILADLYPTFMNGQSADAILKATARLLRGEYGYADLHRTALNDIALADFVHYKSNGDKWFATARLTRLLKELDKPFFGSAVPVPAELAPWERGARAAFLLAELSANPDAPAVKWLKEAVLDAWDKIQRAFELRIKHHASWRDGPVEEAPTGPTVVVSTPAMTITVEPPPQ